jgi:hypothetical protein
MDEIINKVAGSGIISIDLADFAEPGDRVIFDIKPHLFMEQILKEKEFRAFVKEHDWSGYAGKIVGITCTAEAIVPTWAYMLLALSLEPHAKKVFFANAQQLEDLLFAESLSKLDVSQFRDARVVVKGCGDVPVPVNAYVMLSAKLRPYVKSLMYGEPCSTVPLFKAPKTGG